MKLAKREASAPEGTAQMHVTTTGGKKKAQAAGRGREVEGKTNIQEP